MFAIFLNMILCLLPVDKLSLVEIDHYIQNHFAEYDSISYSIQDDLSSTAELEINHSRSSNRIGNKFFIPVITIEANGVSKEKFLNVEIELYQRIAIAIDHINKGDQIALGNTTFELRDITGFNKSPLTDLERIGSIISKYNMKPGDIIFTEFIDTMPVVNPGDPVNIMYQVGGVHVSFIGTVRQAGAIGDVIKVKAQNQQYSAKVINTNEVLIIE